jgi:hypothetical protein
MRKLFTVFCITLLAAQIADVLQTLGFGLLPQNVAAVLHDLRLPIIIAFAVIILVDMLLDKYKVFNWWYPIMFGINFFTAMSAMNPELFAFTFGFSAIFNLVWVLLEAF